MAAVSETIVREFFEQNGFLVRQQRKFIAPSRKDDEAFDFFVYHPCPAAPDQPVPFVLNSQGLESVRRAVVVVKGWHTETFSTAVLSHAPEIYRFVEPDVFKPALETFGADEPITKILVIPGLPKDQEARDQSIDLLRSKGVDAVLPFHVMLTDLIEHTETNRNYQKSDLLQVIRIFKNYDFFKEPQLELFQPKARRGRIPKKQADPDDAQ